MEEKQEKTKVEVITEYTDMRKVSDKIGDFVKGNLAKLVLVAIIGLYIGQGAFELVKREFNLENFLGRLLTGLIIGVSIYTCLRLSGIADGRRDSVYQSSLNLYKKKKLEVSNAKQYKLTAFCLYKNEVSLEEAKQDFLLANGINYSLWKKGVYEDKESKLYKSLEPEQIRALENVGKVRTPRITTSFLLTDAPKVSKKYKDKVARDDKDYVRDGMIKDAVSVMVCSGAFAYYVLIPIVNGDVLANVLWNLFQVIIWLTFGVIKYVQAKDFMTHEYRESHLVYKIETLSEYLSIMETNEALLDKYDVLKQYEEEELLKIEQKQIEDEKGEEENGIKEDN